jgi:hypothetical protein
VEMNNHIIKGLMDIGTLMSIKATSVVKKLGIMYIFWIKIVQNNIKHRMQTMGIIVEFVRLYAKVLWWLI